MKRLNNILTIALILFLWSACKKEELVLSGSSWVKVLETGNEYFGSHVVQLADGNLLVLSIGKEVDERITVICLRCLGLYCPQ